MREAATPFELTEHVVQQAVQWLRLATELSGALMIALGLVIGMGAFVRAFRRQRNPAHAPEGYNGVRLTFARYLALALEFQLGADILSTAIAPSWDQIGKLGAIAVIRTGLNYFLGKEIREESERAELRDDAERREQAEDLAAPPRDGRGGGAPARPTRAVGGGAVGA